MGTASTSNLIQPFGEWFRDLRMRSGFKCAALSRRAGLSHTYVSDCERGITRPQPRTAVKLADALRLVGDDRVEFFRRVAVARAMGVEGVEAAIDPARNLHLVSTRALLAELRRRGMR